MDHPVLNDPVLDRFRVALTETYGNRLDRAVLFGSRARGDYTPESDYDVAVFLRTYANRDDELWTLAEITTEILRETGALISAKPFRMGEDAESRPLMMEIARDGLEL